MNKYRVIDPTHPLYDRAVIIRNGPDEQGVVCIAPSPEGKWHLATMAQLQGTEEPAPTWYRVTDHRNLLYGETVRIVSEHHDPCRVMTQDGRAGWAWLFQLTPIKAEENPPVCALCHRAPATHTRSPQHKPYERLFVCDSVKCREVAIEAGFIARVSLSEGDVPMSTTLKTPVAEKDTTKLYLTPEHPIGSIVTDHSVTGTITNIEIIYTITTPDDEVITRRAHEIARVPFTEEEAWHDVMLLIGILVKEGYDNKKIRNVCYTRLGDLQKEADQKWISSATHERDRERLNRLIMGARAHLNRMNAASERSLENTAV